VLEFYKDAANRNQDPEGKAIFELMIRVEESHIAELQEKFEEIVRQEKDLEHAPIFLHFNPSELVQLVPNLSRYEKDGEIRLDAKASLSLILTMTRSSADFFKTYAEKFSETQGKQILLVFAGQEESHADFVRQRMMESVPVPQSASVS
jgi:rubrerythrin